MKEANPLVYLFQQVWRYSGDYRSHVVLYWIMFIVSKSIELFSQPLILAIIINTIQKEGVTKENYITLLGLLGLTLLIEVIVWALHGPARCIEVNHAFRVKANYRKYLLKGIMTLPMEWHVNHHSGDTIDKIEKGSTAILSFSERSFLIIYAIVQLLVSYGMLIYFSPPSAYLVLGMIFIAGWITTRFDKVMIGQYKALNKAENKISESVFDAISNITTVIILRVERLVFTSISHKIDQPFQLWKDNQVLNETKWFLVYMCSKVMSVLVLGAYVWSHLKSTEGILIGSIFLLMQYLERIGDLLFRFTEMYSDIVKQKTRIANAEELASDFKPESFTNHVLPHAWRELYIRGLNFSYHGEGNGDLHLQNVSLSLRHGERIAFVGASGSGKTTVLKVMRGLYDPQNLALTVDAQLVPDGFGGISRAIALIPQNPEIFATTIRENITLGTECNPETITYVTGMACITDVINELPHGLESSIKEKGVNLSGGQQQRLALARGLLACLDKDIVLLDEPTSSLDTATEMTVYQNIFREFKGKTIISSIHRLHLLPLFDKIYMFHDGEIIGSGTLSELLESCPQFQTLWHQYNEQR